MAETKPNRIPASDSLSQFVRGMGVSGYQRGPLSWADDARLGGVWGNAYATSWIARAAVDAIPEDCFKRGYQWVADPAQITAIEAVEKRNSIQKKKRQALSLSRLDGEAYLYMDVAQGSIGSELSIERVGAGGLRFVNVLRKNHIAKGQVITDPLSQYYGQPEYYEVSGRAAGPVRIHPSRVLRFVNAPDPETGEGRSVLDYLMGVIVAAETVRDNTVALTTQARLHIMKVCGLVAQLEDDPDGVTARFRLANELMRTNGMLVIDKDSEDYDQKQPGYTTLPDVIEAMRREVAAAIGVPYPILFGRAGGLGTNGEMEIKTYYDNIATMQRNDIQPVCEPLDEVVIRSALGSRPDEIYIDWLSLYEMSDQDKATVAKTYADAAQVSVNAGVIPPDVLTDSLINSWVELGAFQGIEQSYEDWVAGGGVLEDPSDESDVAGRGVEDDPDAG